MDDESFIRLCEARAEALYRTAYSLLGARQDAEDAVQQALLRAWAARDRVRPGSERAWLLRIAVNECRNIQRERMRTTPVERVPERAEPFEPPDIALRDAVDKLPEGLRLPLLLRYMEEMKESEIAAALGLSVTAVKSRLFRARRALRKALGEEVLWP